MMEALGLLSKLPEVRATLSTPTHPHDDGASPIAHRKTICPGEEPSASQTSGVSEAAHVDKLQNPTGKKCSPASTKSVVSYWDNLMTSLAVLRYWCDGFVNRRTSMKAL